MLPLMLPRVLFKDPRYSIGYLEDCDMLVIKTFVLVPMALKPRAQHVPPMVLIFVRLVPVDITKLAAHALDALRLVALEQEKRLLALRHRIVFVLKTFVLVPMAL